MPRPTSFQALESLRARVGRMLAACMRTAGDGFSSSHVFEDGERHSYSVSRIKSPEQLDDELHNAFQWIWNLKDHLKAAYRSKNLDERQVEKAVNDCLALQYVSDIANGAKHAGLRESRSGYFAELVDVGLTIPQTAIASITFGAFNVATDVSKPEEVILRASIQPRERPALDAFAVLTEAVEAWERVAQRISD